MISVVVPIFNELENIPVLYERLKSVLDETNEPYELLFVDDGSTDGSTDRLKQLAAEDSHVKLIVFRRNYGQTAAMDAGLHAASGDVVVTIDGDLQNEPGDIPMLVAKLREGYDLVHGWRKNRKDALLVRKVPSKIANWLISKVTGFPVHDLGCTLKAMRRELVDDLHLYGEMHRFIPILAHWQGARCVEVVTRHHPRRFGQSKYGLSRTFRVLLDLMTVKYLIQYMVAPMRLFGAMGLTAGGVGALAGLATLWMKLVHGIDITGNPLFLLAVFCVLVAMQFFTLGMLGELGTRAYYESQGRRPYTIRERINFEQQKQETVSSSTAVTSSEQTQQRQAA